MAVAIGGDYMRSWAQIQEVNYFQHLFVDGTTNGKIEINGDTTWGKGINAGIPWQIAESQVIILSEKTLRFSSKVFL